MLSFVLHRMLCLPMITPGRCKRILTVLLTLFFFRAGTLTILTSSSKFYFNGDICVSLQVHPIKIKYLGFSRVRKGRDVNE